MTMTHTPLPWSWINSKWDEGRAGHLSGESKSVLDSRGFIYATRPDAAFILMACNNFPEMLEALRVLATLSLQSYDYCDVADFKEATDDALALVTRIDKGDHQNDCDICGQPVKVGNIHKHCADYEQASADKGDA